MTDIHLETRTWQQMPDLSCRRLWTDTRWAAHFINQRPWAPLTPTVYAEDFPAENWLSSSSLSTPLLAETVSSQGSGLNASAAHLSLSDSLASSSSSVTDSTDPTRKGVG